ncbi:MAG TPA: HEPN domain-containing protein [Dehalococcoidia bacterium]
MNEPNRPLYGAAELDATLGPVISLISTVYEPEEVVLFGSAAQDRPWHDLDLMVVTDTEDEVLERQHKVRVALRQPGLPPVDVFVYTPDEVRTQIRENRFFLVEEVLGKGRRVVDRHGRFLRRRSRGSALDRYLREGIRPETQEMAADARQWLDQAREDRRWASFNIDGKFYPQTCFACQQSAEKLLKAFLIAHERTMPRTHDLTALLRRCTAIEARIEGLESDAAFLEGHYMAARYPDVELPDGPPSEADARRATEGLSRLFEVVEPLIEAWLKERR